MTKQSQDPSSKNTYAEMQSTYIPHSLAKERWVWLARLHAHRREVPFTPKCTNQSASEVAVILSRSLVREGTSYIC